MSASNFFVQGNVTTVTAFADPVIHFADGFDSTGYSIQVSPGIGNGAASVPEPGTLALLVVSLGWLAGWAKIGRDLAYARPVSCETIATNGDGDRGNKSVASLAARR